MPGAAGMLKRCSVPVAGTNPAATSSAYSRTSMAWPPMRASRACGGSGSPSAIRSCSSTRSRPVTSSVTGCSTWSLVFISRKQKDPSRSSTNSTVPAPV